MNKKKTYKILTLLLLMQWAFIQIIAQYPTFIERYYSKGLYMYVSQLLRGILGWVPFSVGDLLYTFLGLLIIKGIYKIIKEKHINVKDTFFKGGAIVSILFFLFHFNWGLNYFRTPLFKSLNLEKTTYTINELIEFTNKIIIKTNNSQLLITKNDTLVVNNNLNKKQLKKLSTNAYQQLAIEYPQFKLKNTSLKHSLYSVPLSYMGFAGYLNPFTNEAQVNKLIPTNNYPATICHEIAHQVGIASESEANFVGYLASIHSQDVYYNYSGYLLALRYCLSEIYKTNPTEYEQLLPTIHKGVLKDMQQSQDFWQSYQNWSEQYFKLFYDYFLKANKQADGIQSYNKMVSLLINYYKIKSI
jgi:hypothetical protein